MTEQPRAVAGSGNFVADQLWRAGRAAMRVLLDIELVVEGEMARPSTPLSIRASQPTIVTACLADLRAGPMSPTGSSDDA